jgi:hypothetical protein
MRQRLLFAACMLVGVMFSYAGLQTDADVIDRVAGLFLGAIGLAFTVLAVVLARRWRS